MKALVCMLVICVSWVTGQDLSCSCGWRNAKKIVNGKATRKNEYPWMAYLSNGCGGSIITQWHILTAAHCTDGAKPSDIVVSVGMYFKYYGKNENKQEYRIERIIQHEGYADDKFVDDISVLLLTNPITFNQYVGPVCMPYIKFNLVGKTVKVTGWGLTKGTGNNNVLREVDLKVISNSVCNKQWTEILPTQVCAYARGKDSCNGDSGGALVYLDPATNRYTQVALVSYGPDKCGTDPRASVNTNVFSFIEWIEEAVKSKDGAKTCSKVIK